MDGKQQGGNKPSFLSRTLLGIQNPEGRDKNQIFFPAKNLLLFGVTQKSKQVKIDTFCPNR